MISDNLQKQIIEAMKAKDSVRVSTLRMLHSELKNAQIDKGGALDEDEELKVVQKEAKKRKDAIEGFEKGGNTAAADNERAELEILSAYLPADLTDEELETLVVEAISESGASAPNEMGKVMPILMPKVAGRADGKRVSDMVVKKLQS